MSEYFQKLRTRTKAFFSFNTKQVGTVALYGSGFLLIGAAFVGISTDFNPVIYEQIVADVTPEILKKDPVWPLPLDIDAYNQKMLSLAHYMPPQPQVASTTASTTPQVALPVSTETMSVSVPKSLWPAPAAYPNGGAILPFSRIIAYYGNFYSTRMGVLGEYSKEVVVQKLKDEVAAWTKADPETPAIPAIHYIAAVAQADAGKLGYYRAQMPDAEMEKALTMANEIDGLLFLDLQIGKSTIENELPAISEFLKKPNVHLGLDPEFSMKYGDAPGHVIGTFDATDINYAIEYLAQIVRDNKLPPKILVIHRFTQDMVTNYQNIKPLPEVQVVMDMDGWGEPAKKKGTYNRVIYPEPVQFTGVKLFYGNDLKAPSTRLLTMDEVLNLTPSPIYIQYQ
ncbi:hypothetical protein GW943_02015 [Candidatus Parcubacteria bacterium]|uniref:Lipoprotein n=1 Tax=Candidatus Kaiserbacteria bacterium CG10_big_fil_rev_8_21_14_0_10_47_16 TaxID=1974608 RepID=A0A2H0UG78_9BACT|nr:hypothetical protein [Candidatus Parcubacteria bacterium]PIR84805.1 MAG: hypothetical protein COU16_01305 [Candidatus Kaiserbacteria bacterium CG10_big_fil_rev_8_21_14_0_10_47_16]